ncbi:MAG TPA: TonB family protein [Thermoanaerobaculia bacterium]|nr:TonB family protein [Thermoanaerobaculia bacterium]
MPALDPELDRTYEILDEISAGETGAVYLVRHRLLDEIRVVKVIDPPEISPEATERFLREARLALQFRHPNIAHVDDFSVGAGGRAFIVKEFIEGRTLADVLKRAGPLSVGLALALGQQALEVIGYLHRKGYLHRDLAPDNLMLTRDVDGGPLLKMMELGLSRVLNTGNEPSASGTFLGRMRYAAPEKFGRGEEVDERSDLYSLTVVLYELLTGRHPFTGKDTSSIVADHLFRPPLDFAETDPGGVVPADLRAILLKGLAKRPEERFASSADLAAQLAAVAVRYPVEPQDLDRLLGPAAAKSPPPAAPTVILPVVGPQPAAAPAAAAPAAAPPAGRRRPAALVAAALVAAALLAVGIGGYLGYRSQRSQRAPAASEPAADSPQPTTPPAAESGTEAAAAPPPAARPPDPPQPVPKAQTAPRAVSSPAVQPPAASPPAAAPPSPALPPARPSARTTVEVPVDFEGEGGGASGKTKKGSGDLLAPGPDVENAEVTSMPAPVYPEAARGTGTRAHVVLGVLVDEKGAVVEVKVKSIDTPGKGFEEAARAAALQTRFRPATRNGVPGRSWGELTFDFGAAEPKP